MTRVALLALCALLLLGAVAGCATTQDTAELKQAESKRILEARAKKQRQRAKSHEHGREKR
ncbi:MAG TPA: hypothetical protein VHQ43_07510 [Solirubrobacterales bacterium]|jgi:hypothetical protein|nr:hypothetical protein [Solirubrobacterales bacterium]